MVERVFHDIKSARLLLRRFQESDLESFHAYRSEPIIEKYQGWGEVTVEDSQRIIEAVKDSNPGSPGDRSQIAIELLESGEMIGDLYLHVFADEPEQAEIGLLACTRLPSAGVRNRSRYRPFGLRILNSKLASC